MGLGGCRCVAAYPGSTASGYISNVKLLVPSPGDFDDVLPDYWAYAEIEACYRAGVVTGFLNGTYQPKLRVTRDEMAVYVSRADAGGDAQVPSGPAQASFPDVPVDYWAFRYIEYCKARDIVRGYSDGYHPGEEVDWGQMAVYIARALAGGDAQVPPGPVNPSFPDVEQTDWDYRYVEYLVDLHVVRGYPDGLYHPEFVVTRDQMAVYVARAFHLPV
jgi:hypothetical protein